jgi:hypothetical protein
VLKRAVGAERHKSLRGLRRDRHAEQHGDQEVLHGAPPPFKFFILAKVIVRKKGQQALPKFPFPVDFMKPATIFGLSDAEEKIDT